MPKLQLDGYKRDYNLEIWKEYYCLGKKTYYKLKSLPAAKSQKFVEFPGAQRARWTKFLELDFFI